MPFEPGRHGHVADAEAKVVELAASMSVAEIARETGISEPTVKKLLAEHEVEAVQVVDERVIARRFDNLAVAQLTLAEKATAKALELLAEDREMGDTPKDRTDRLRAIQAVVQASGVAVDKASLLSGRATERTETHDDASFQQAQAIVARIIEMQTGHGPRPKGAIEAKVVE